MLKVQISRIRYRFHVKLVNRLSLCPYGGKRRKQQQQEEEEEEEEEEEGKKWVRGGRGMTK